MVGGEDRRHSGHAGQRINALHDRCHRTCATRPFRHREARYRYGKLLFDKLAKLLYDNSISMRVSPRLPQDWSTDTPNSSIWTGTEPRLLVIHYSCFQDEDGVDDDVLEERRVDFNELFASLANTDVKILICSRAFWDYPTFVQENITRANREAFKDGRLLMLPLRHGVSIGPDDIKRFERLVDQALAN